ncbi:MAG: alpha/beta hydrolase [Bacteroidetes bacterium]|nr:alpha/beta hydrolase [Bacteroidota bacterium]MBI3481762.1 alpha/beta hydrolase [Bacteroidota bacterium]
MNPIILLHGALGSSSQLQPLANKLQEKGGKVFLLNFSGHSGRVFSKNGFGIEVFADDLLELLDKEKINRADIFGYSMGGYVALWLAYLHPKRLDKIVTLGTKFDWSISSADKEIKKMNAEKIEEKVPAFARLLQQRHTPNDWKEVLKKTADMMFDLGQKPLLTEDVFKKIKSPVEILLGDRDDMADLDFSKQVAAWLPFGKFELLQNTPHPIEKVQLNYIVQKFDELK